LAKMSATAGTLIAYATGPGDVAADGGGTNSPYTLALSRAMKTSGLTVERMFKQVRNEVRRQTNERQTPWESSSLTGADFYFKGGAATPAATAQPMLQSRPSETPDMVGWRSVRNSANPAEIEAFVAAFPASPFAGIARARLQALKQKPPGAVAAPAKQSPAAAPAKAGQAALAPAYFPGTSVSPETAPLISLPQLQGYTVEAARKRLLERGFVGPVTLVTRDCPRRKLVPGKICGYSPCCGDRHRPDVAIELVVPVARRANGG